MSPFSFIINPRKKMTVLAQKEVFFFCMVETFLLYIKAYSSGTISGVSWNISFSIHSSYNNKTISHEPRQQKYNVKGDIGK